MISKKQRTLDLYMQAGAEMRLLKTLASKLSIDISQFVYRRDWDKFERALRIIDEVCSKAEDNMFADYPDLTNDYIHVFYSTTNVKPVNDADRKTLAIAREVADKLVYKTPEADNDRS